MALYPAARAAVDAALTEPKVWDADIATVRAQAQRLALAEPREDVAEVRDVDAGGVACRLYVPAGAVPGVIVHVHGGGFVFNDIEVHDASARRLANRTRRSVLSVDYRRPPEHRFPAAPDDVDTVLRWLAADALGTQPAYVHGDSAGGNLALVAALRNPGRVAAVLLIYPFLDPEQGFASYTTAADGFDPAEAAWYWEQYAATRTDLADPDLAPLLAADDALAALPPTLVVTAEHDPLRDEGEHLAARLAGLGVPVTGLRVLGLTHGFWRHPGPFPAAESVLALTASFLDRHPAAQHYVVGHD